VLESNLFVPLPIALLCKVWKSHGRTDESRGLQPWRILCEVYAQLLAMVVHHWLFLVSGWTSPHRSLTKAAQTVQQHALPMASAFGRLTSLVMAITTVTRWLAAGGGCIGGKSIRIPINSCSRHQVYDESLRLMHMRDVMGHSPQALRSPSLSCGVE
jgi:hypothetical protein